LNARRVRRASPALASVVVALAMGACGGDSESPGDDGAAPASTASAPSSSLTPPTLTRSELAGRVQTFDPATLPRGHTQGPVTYDQKPPVGGNHAPMWQNCGAYSEPVRTELAVHSLEHGAVWITYRPSLARAEVDMLRALSTTSRYVLLSPWADETLPSIVVASAWGVQLKADSVTDPALAAFVKEYAAGPQTPEPGAPCSGGFGTPR
jgi:hypothetical protein